MSLPARFMAKVSVEGECWAWIAATDTHGYGRFSAPGRVAKLAHRFAYEALVGPVPEGLELDHLCRNRACVNPAHLEPVTHAENVRRGSRSYGARTVCRNGLHDITDPANVKVRPTGARSCAECVRAAWRRKEQRRKERRITQGRAA